MSRCCGTVESTQRHHLAAPSPAVRARSIYQNWWRLGLLLSCPRWLFMDFRGCGLVVKCCSFALFGKQGGDVTLRGADGPVLDTFFYISLWTYFRWKSLKSLRGQLMIPGFDGANWHCCVHMMVLNSCFSGGMIVEHPCFINCSLSSLQEVSSCSHMNIISWIQLK